MHDMSAIAQVVERVGCICSSFAASGLALRIARAHKYSIVDAPYLLWVMGFGETN
jgi:hypothetical protein